MAQGKRAGLSATQTLSTCHMSILEEPAKIAGVIAEAAKMALAI
jgi:hypothetical protein